LTVLGIETSSRAGSVALCDGDRLVGEVFLDMEQAHSERLMPALDAMMRLGGHQLADVALIAVSAGPGSFTALRIGVATGKSLAFALGIPAVAVPTFDAIAYPHRHEQRDICVLLDARHGEVYAARYSIGGTEQAVPGLGHFARAGPFRRIAIGALLAEIQAPTLFVGDAVGAYRDRISDAVGSPAALADGDAAVPRAPATAFLGLQKFRTCPTAPAAAASLSPVYLRRSQAEARLAENGVPP
jgi:tRNA threonylcarbamoyladenosine biosynthesis protein TsaB